MKPAEPAFPRSGGGKAMPQDGMTLRDYFAGQALTGYAYALPDGVNYKDMAAICYRFADAMIAQRSK